MTISDRDLSVLLRKLADDIDAVAPTGCTCSGSRAFTRIVCTLIGGGVGDGLDRELDFHRPHCALFVAKGPA